MYKKVSKQIFNEVFKFTNEGDTIEGFLTNVSIRDGIDKKSKVLEFKTDSGVFDVFVTSDLMGYNWNELAGMKIKITFVEWKVLKRPYKSFDVEIKEEG